MPGQDEPLCLLQPAWSELKHCIRDSLQHHALRGLEARRPGTFGGLGGGLDRAACRHGLRVAQPELEASLLRGLVGGRHGHRSARPGTGSGTARGAPTAGPR